MPDSDLALLTWRAPAGAPVPGLALAVDLSDGALVRVEILSTPPLRHAGPGDRARAAACAPALDALAAYLAGASREIRVPHRLPKDLPPVHRVALEALATIPYAATVTYGDLAKRIGHPRAARAVGAAMARNPLPLVLPCHRVVAARGLGGFGPGVGLKQALLTHEARHPRRGPSSGYRRS